MTNRINYTKNGNVIAIECFDNDRDADGWGARLCECVLDCQKWAKCVDAGGYLIDDAAEMETLLEFIKAFNAAEMDNEDLNNAINDWQMLI